VKTYILLLAFLLAGCGGAFTSAPEGSREPRDDAEAPDAQAPSPDAPPGQDGAAPGCSCDYLTGGGCPAGQVSVLCRGPAGCRPAEGGPWTASGETDGGLLLFCGEPVGKGDAGDPPDASAEASPPEDSGPPACPSSYKGEQPCGYWAGYAECPACPAGNACDAPTMGTCQATGCTADPGSDSECSGSRPNAYACPSADPPPTGCVPGRLDALGIYCCG
jgi:hypothetical protein